MSVGPPGASSLWRDISKSLHVAILAAAVFDDDVLLYELWVDGELKDHYVSDTAVSDPDAKRSGPEGGDPRVLCSVFKY
jgi:hypothetical protein